MQSFFLQISDKYENQYQRSLAKVKKERAFLERELNNLETVEVFPSQANYIMCEIKNELLSSRLLAEKLLEKDIFIKDLTPKIKNGKQYIRLAVRNRDDNIKLVDAMKELL